jgi:hypothetical protein
VADERITVDLLWMDGAGAIPTSLNPLRSSS